MSNTERASDFVIRPPSSSSAKSDTTTFPKPSIDFISGKWHVTHSTLPMWKNNRNVTITYSLLTEPEGRIDDLVEYQSINSDKPKSIHGIDRPHPEIPAAYNWRGKGWLMIASSHWEIIGHGDHDDGWLVTFFEKTMFTPAGIDICTKRKGGVSKEMLEQIRAEMKKIDDPVFQKQADQIFEVKHD